MKKPASAPDRVVLALLPLLLIGILAAPAFAQQPVASQLKLTDRPNDDGSALLLTFDLTGWDETTRVRTEVEVDGEWLPSLMFPQLITPVPTKGGSPEYFGWHAADPEQRVLVVDRYIFIQDPTAEELAENPDAVPQPQPVYLEAANTYHVRLMVLHGGVESYYDAGSMKTDEQWFNVAATNNLVMCVIFAAIIMGFIMAARRNPNLFIRRINGLEAVDEAIGRATEMGKPVLQVNGLDPLSTLSTIAAVNILGRVARRVANYDSELLVPCFDPVVMTVSQEVVKNAYLEAGRPDAYREENIYFVTDQQFSYVASVCGIMMREKPAANFLLGYFYAESLLLAETGFTTGAIQIAGTDALAQLPFFITTCDYTLIGEELYAASAYLSREPMLLGSLKGQDIGKGFVMLMILLGTILATIGVYLTTGNWNWLVEMLTPLM
ncbi:hypothetical protein JW859_13745 [bacterium]|nr:hypothetical protein [bacterium]